MPLPESVIIVCAGTDAIHAADTGHPLLDLCLTLQAPQTVSRTGQARPNCYLGLRDPGIDANRLDVKAVAEKVIMECHRTHARGVFADLETNTPSIRALCRTLDEEMAKTNLTLFVPSARANDVKYGIITFVTAMSGGSLAERLQKAQTTYGSNRIAVLLDPVSSDFCLPSKTPDGIHLSTKERQTLLTQYHSQVFFSSELYAKYFTYMDEQQRGHFVLFDDKDTLSAKISLLDRYQIRYRFAIYPDVAPLLQRTSTAS